MKLETLLGGIKPLKATTTAVEIKNIRFDSRLVEQGDLFVATRGTVVDWAHFH